MENICNMRYIRKLTAYCFVSIVSVLQDLQHRSVVVNDGTFDSFRDAACTGDLGDIIQASLSFQSITSMNEISFEQITYL